MTEALKDSKVEWAGKIPLSWTVTKNKYCFTNKKRLVGEKWNETQLLSLTKNGVKKKDINDGGGKQPDSFSTYQYVVPNQIVMCLFDLDQSAVFSGISQYGGMISPAYKILTCMNNTIPKYMSYWFDFVFQGRKFKTYSKNIRYTLDYDEFGKLPIILPPRDEQEKIADFLDEKCAEIDKLSEDIQKQIDILEEYKKSVITRAVTKGLDLNAEMKDSGIDWLGFTNGNWKISKIKYICDFSPTCKTRGVDENTEVSYEPMEFIKNGFFQNNPARYSEIPKSLTPFENGDIVIAKVTPCFENGNIAIVNDLYSGIGFGSSELFVLRAKGVKTKFLFYWLQNSHFIGAGCSTMIGVGGLKRVSSAFVQNSEICLPPEDIQEKIVDFLDKKIPDINQSIRTKNQQLDNLANYKKSIIYEYITGKKRVV